MNSCEKKEQYNIKIFERGYPLTGLLFPVEPQYNIEIGQVDEFGNIKDLHGNKVSPKLPSTSGEVFISALSNKKPDRIVSVFSAYDEETNELELKATMPDSDGKRHMGGV